MSQRSKLQYKQASAGGALILGLKGSYVESMTSPGAACKIQEQPRPPGVEISNTATNISIPVRGVQQGYIRTLAAPGAKCRLLPLACHCQDLCYRRLSRCSCGAFRAAQR